MARFREKRSTTVVSAERLRTSKQVETASRNWVTAGAGNWLVTPLLGKCEVYEDPEFRDRFEPVDEDAKIALEQPGPDGRVFVPPDPEPAPEPPPEPAPTPEPEPVPAPPELKGTAPVPRAASRRRRGGRKRA